MNWKRLFFSFRGRINRKTFWICLIAVWILPAIYMILMANPITLPQSYPHSPEDEFIFNVLVILVLVVMLMTLTSVYAQMAVTAKRLHDTGRSAWLLCWLFVINFIHFAKLGGHFRGSVFDLIIIAIAAYFIVVCGFFRGHPEANKYGDLPK